MDLQHPSDGVALVPANHQLLIEGCVEELEPLLGTVHTGSVFSSPPQLHYAATEYGEVF